MSKGTTRAEDWDPPTSMGFLLDADDRVNDAPSPLHTGQRDPAGSVTGGDQRENVAIAVLFRSGEDQRMKRETLVKQALRPLPIYIVE